MWTIISGKMPRFFSRHDRRLIARAVNTGKRTFAGTRQLCRVTKIYDGDTIHVVTKLSKREAYAEYPVRLYGIDAPEIRPSADLPNRELHKQAAIVVRDRLAELIPVDSVVCIDFEKEEKYGRLMGRVWTISPECCWCRWVPDENVALQLLKEGLVLEYSGGTKTEFSEAQLRRIANVAPATPVTCGDSSSLYPTIFETEEEASN